MSGGSSKGSPPDWTPERIAQLDRAGIENLRANALRLGAQLVVDRCDAELLRRRRPKSTRMSAKQAGRSSNSVVTGYHFVCANDLGVTPLDGGNFRSGSWVVDEANVESSLNYGAYLALHQSKAEPSYRQGRIVSFRRTPRNMVETEEGGKIAEGVEFEVAATVESYAWVGSGAGEKGYKWTGIEEIERGEGESS